jgi:hypothetical protein
MPFEAYEAFKEDFSDLEDKIIYLLQNDNYLKLATISQTEYNTKHNPEKCYEYYHSIIKKHNFI